MLGDINLLVDIVGRRTVVDINLGLIFHYDIFKIMVGLSVVGCSIGVVGVALWCGGCSDEAWWL